ncbi:MAG: TIGR03960 family B12-binding radical SAM protein [Phascolarctobacterium sp.]|nr:TIGR03960 family B12-binding radical SAM protein [Candidatus Phascolarctobacterium caballi]
MENLSIDVLNKIEHPSRYIGGEFASIVKQNVNVRIALAFPDVYEVGMSYLGFKILYHLVNKEENLAAERVYAPWTDMEQVIREKDLFLRTLETKRALYECDFVGFTLQYELSYTNILNMLELGGIPIKAKDRNCDEPFVIVGGPCVFNCEPLAEFIDLAIIGDGEDALIEIMRLYENWKKAGKIGGRNGFLKQAAKIKGIYVPSYFDIQYNEDGTVSEVETINGQAKTIYKRIVSDLNVVDFPVSPVVPFAAIVHDRIMLEIFRGCSRGCRFCNAGMIYRPVRERSLEKLLELGRQLVKNTGYNEISLFSLSSADYSNLVPLVHNMIEEFRDKRVSVSLPSLRIDSFCVAVAKEVNAVRKSGLTFAPEAGSQRMRDIINKGVTEADLLKAVTAAFENGWSAVKLYFMIGLPFETDEDILAIANLVKSVQYKYYEVTGKHGCRVTVSASAFVPKPYTAFQWFGQNSIEEIQRKQMLLKDALKIKNVVFQYHDAQTSVIEALIARGDRRIGQVIYNAWKAGARFDGWSDHFSFDRWQQAVQDADLNMDFYTSRQRDLNERFPWEHTSPGVSKEFLLSEWRKAQKQQLTKDCRRTVCKGCGVCQMLGVKVVDYGEKKSENQNANY